MVLAAAVALLVAPCGPGCDWPAHVATAIYSLTIIILKRNDRLALRTGCVLLSISIIFLGFSLYNRAQFEGKMRERMQELRRKAIETQNTIQEDTEPATGGNASRPTA